MPKPITLKLLLRVLRLKGFIFISQTGSHAKYRKIGNPTLSVIIPIHGKEIPYGTFSSILKQSQLSYEDFIK